MEKLTKPAWVKIKEPELKKIIAELASKFPPSKVGIILRDQYGIPDVKLVTGKSITAILKEKKLTGDLPEDLMILIKKNITLRKHIESNKKDEVSNRGLILSNSRIRRISKYYINSKVLPLGWKYDSERFKILVD